VSGARATAVQIRVLQNLPLVLLVLVFAVFSALDSRFFDPDTLLNVARQASYIGILAVGLTFVLITAGIDLSVGSIMYLAAVVVSDVLGAFAVPVLAVPLMTMAIGLVLGAVNAFGVTLLRIIPFIVTLATLTAYRGIALTQSQSREANYPSEITAISSTTVLGIPVPVIVFALVVLVAHVVLTRTALGRQVYAVGQDRAAAERAGIPARRVLATVYVISGGLAGLAAFVAVSQLGTVSPAFGTNDEFDAIAAAVLGGTSLFGGRGNVFPGTVVGALLVQLIAVGLVFTQVDLYLTPMVSAAIIFLAVLLDTVRTRQLARLERRSIRVESGSEDRPAPVSPSVLEGDRA
jgi:ribose transport system permease protein